MFNGETALSVPTQIDFSTFSCKHALMTFCEPMTFVLIASKGLYSIIGTCFSAAA